MANEAGRQACAAEVALREAGAAEIILRGAWTLEERCPAAGEIWRAVEREQAVKRIRFDAGDVTAWDSVFTTFLSRLIKEAEDREIAVDTASLPAGARRLLALARAVPEASSAERSAPSEGALARLGNATLRSLEGIKNALDFTGQAVLGIGALCRGRARFRGVDLVEYLQECGVSALPIVSLLSVLVGMILAFVGASQLRIFGAEIFVANLVAAGMAIEMGALMTAIVMAGRTGAAFAARLGTMQVNEEIDAFTTFGFDPFQFLVLPRMVALILMMPLLSLYANLLGILGGAVIGVGMLGIEPAQYYTQTREAASLLNFAQGLVKAAAFGVVIAVTGCLQGMRCGRSAQAVGEATTRAVVMCIIYIVVVDAVFNVIYTLVL